MKSRIRRATVRSHGILTLSSLLAAAVMLLILITGGTPSVYMNMMYIPIALVSTYSGKWRASIFSLFWGFIPIPMLLLWGYGIEPVKQIITRPATFIVLSLIIGSLSDFHRERLIKEETFDSLTGLKRLPVLVESLKESKGQKDLVLVNISNLRTITGIFSYEFSFDFIKAFTAILNTLPERYREVEVYRLVENGFLIEIPSEKGKKSPLDVIMEELRDIHTSIIDVNDVQVYIELRFGIVEKTCGAAPEECIKQASLALKYAQDNGLREFVYEKKLDENFSLQMYILNNFKEALKKGRIRLAYQNIYLNDGKTLHSREFLSRWVKDDGSLIPPAVFIPLIEQTDLIHLLTRRVIDCTLKFISSKMDEEKDVIASINFSSKDFNHANIDYLVKRIEETGIDPSIIQVEITEETLRNMQMLKDSVEKLKNAGVRIVIDDFGTGYSSYELLAKLSISGVKIDRSIIANIDKSFRYKKLCNNLADFCRTFHLTTVAEGVETESIADTCRDIGIDYLQGFLYSRPILIEGSDSSCSDL